MDSILPHDRQNHQSLNVNIGANNAFLYIYGVRNGPVKIGSCRDIFLMPTTQNDFKLSKMRDMENVLVFGGEAILGKTRTLVRIN